MVNGNSNKGKLVVITLLITTFLFGLVSISEAKRISDAEAKDIQTFLKISNVPVLKNYSEEDLKKILNKKIQAEIPDVTYGLLVLSAKDDLEFMDMILTQEYKDRGKEYFNTLLNKKLNLFSHWKNVGQDIYFLISKGDQIGPLSGLAMESVSMTNKVVEVFGAIKTLQDIRKYDGLWYYFDLRKQGNEPHEIAWSEAKIVMGGAAKPTFSFRGINKIIDDNNTQLEAQFVALWDKWGAYATPFGISEKYKKQVRNELNNTLAVALESQSFAEEKQKLSLLDRLVEQFEKLRETATALISQMNPFKAGPIVEVVEVGDQQEDQQEISEMIEAKPPSIEESELMEASPPSIELPLANELEVEPKPIIEEESSSISEEMIEASPQSNESQEVEEDLPEEIPELEEVDTTSSLEPVSEPEPVPQEEEKEIELCQQFSGSPARFKVLINEVAWMGTNNSANNEWIEIKNIWGISLNLSGWQLLDKDQQIKIIFGEEDIIPANGFYLLERTDDDAVPNISADLIYTGALNNNNETLYLFNNQCQLEDKVLAEPDWPAGNNAEKKTMERLDPVNWYTGIVDGTPKAENSSPPAPSTVVAPPPTSSSSASPPAPEPTPVPEPEPEPELEQPLLTVLINEIAWMGTEASAQDEWIEFYNNTSSTINITGWRLISVDGSPDITFPTSTIGARDFYLIERTDDNTVSDITADYFDSFGYGLKNDGEKLELRDANNNLIDLVDCSNGWLAGDNSTKQTMERIDVNNWANNNRVPWDGWQGKDADGNRINGTPKSENSVIKTSTTISPGVFVIDDDFTLTSLGNPYLMEGSISVGVSAKLTIESGVTIKFKHSNYWNSELKVEGELAAADVVFTSFYDATGTQASAGDWEWLYFKDAQANLKNVTIRYAGKKEGNPPFSPPFTRGAVYIDGGQVTIENSKIEKSQTLGIWLKDSSNSLIDNVEFSNIEGNWEKPAAFYIENSGPTIQNSTFRDNKTGIWIESAATPSIKSNLFEENELPIKTFTLLPTFSSNTAQNNNFNGILVKGFGFSDTENQIDWQKANLPYIFESYETINASQTLNIEPGVIIQFKSSARIYVDGTLKAEGTENEKIIFTSLNQTSAGAWDFISFSNSSVNSILDYVVVEYGGWYKQPFKSGAIKINNTDVVISNSLFENNLVAGLELENCTTTIENTIFKDHQAQYGYGGERSKGIWVKNAAPVFSNTVFNNNYYGIYVESGDCPDLSGVTFGTDDNANSINIWPSNCSP